MNRFEIIEKIFKEHGFIIDGRALWSEIEEHIYERGGDTVEFDDFFLDGQKYRCYINVTTTYENDDCDVSINSIDVCRPDGANDEHTFLWNKGE